VPKEIKTAKDNSRKGKTTLIFGDLATGEILEQWHLCLANLLYPFLVLLTNPIVFLIVVFIFTLLGPIVAYRRTSHRLNSLVLSFYPFLFHCCFLIFYSTSSTEILAIAQMVCLSLFLLGSAHHTLTLIYEVLAFAVWFVRTGCKSNKVDPKGSRSKGEQNK
jgi:energy-coupling factor transporter transmembrane protein EcfT